LVLIVIEDEEGSKDIVF